MEATTGSIKMALLKGLAAASRGPAFPVGEHASFGGDRAVALVAKVEREGTFRTWVALFGPKGKEVLLEEEGSLEDYLLGLQRVRFHPSLHPSEEERERALEVLRGLISYQGGRPFLAPSFGKALRQEWEERGVSWEEVQAHRLAWQEGPTLQLTFPQGLLLVGQRESEGVLLLDALFALTPSPPLSLYSLGGHLREGGKRWMEEWMKEIG